MQLGKMGRHRWIHQPWYEIMDIFTDIFIFKMVYNICFIAENSFVYRIWKEECMNCFHLYPIFKLGKDKKAKPIFLAQVCGAV